MHGSPSHNLPPTMVRMRTARKAPSAMRASLSSSDRGRRPVTEPHPRRKRDGSSACLDLTRLEKAGSRPRSTRSSPYLPRNPGSSSTFDTCSAPRTSLAPLPRSVPPSRSKHRPTPPVPTSRPRSLVRLDAHRHACQHVWKVEGRPRRCVSALFRRSLLPPSSLILLPCTCRQRELGLCDRPPRRQECQRTQRRL